MPAGGGVTQTVASTQTHARPAGEPVPAPAPRGILLRADRIITLGHGRHKARAMVVRGKRVMWVGDDPASAPPHGAEIDLRGCVIGPAFVESHGHLTSFGIALMGLDLSEARSGADVLHAVRSYAGQHPGRVVWGHGYDPHGFADELPSPDDLSDAAGGRAVYLSHADGHESLVDRGTLSMAPLARTSGVERSTGGEPTGVVRKEANNIIRRWSIGAMSASELNAARGTAARTAAARGYASVHEMGGPERSGLDDFEAWRTGSWPIDLVLYWGDLDLSFAIERNLRQVGGDILLDGSVVSRTAALEAPYSDGFGTGRLEYDDATLITFFTEAVHAGLQVAVHVVGDAAIRQAVRCWQAVEPELPDYEQGAIQRLRPRLEHALVVAPDLFDDIASLGLLVSGQPAFETSWGFGGGVFDARLGAERSAWTSPYRALADRGIGLAFGSGSTAEPMDPWAAVYAAQRRRHEEHALSRLEAVSASTLGGRHAARQDRYVGGVRAGMLADVAVWEGDPYMADDPRGSRCVMTLMRGRRTHGSSSAVPAWEPTD